MTYLAEFVMAHGAGQSKDSEFMQTCSQLFAKHQILCTQFNFDYMEKAIALGKRRPPDIMSKLMIRFQSELTSMSGIPLFIGGKSMGGRVSTMILQESKALGAVCFGYPFHPPGKPEKLRIEHFQEITKPIVILQGERDPFGKRVEINDYLLPGNIDIQFIEDGEHSFKPLKSSPVSWHDNIIDAVEKAVQFIHTNLKAHQ